MKAIVTTILILATAPAFAQQVEHAPTVAQCQADQRLWLSRMEDTNDKLKDVTFKMLSAWTQEISSSPHIKRQGAVKNLRQRTFRPSLLCPSFACPTI
jgi:hypothetical protein